MTEGDHAGELGACQEAGRGGVPNAWIAPRLGANSVALRRPRRAGGCHCLPTTVLGSFVATGSVLRMKSNELGVSRLVTRPLRKPSGGSESGNTETILATSSALDTRSADSQLARSRRLQLWDPALAGDEAAPWAFGVGGFPRRSPELPPG